MIIETMILASIGLIAGFLGGLLGIGGGIFTVPAFLLFFHLFRFPSDYTMHVAIGTSLGIMMFTAVSSTWSHFLQKGIQWKFLRYYSPGVALGVVLGAMIADWLPGRILVLLFSLYIFCFGVYFLISAKKSINPYAFASSLKNPYPATTAGVGVITGIVSAILGVGGAPVTIPYLTMHRVELKHAISTSAFVSLLVGFIGSLSYLYFGLNGNASHGSIGYLYIPGMIVSGLASVVSAPLGAKLAYSLPTGILRGVFGAFLIIVSFVLLTR